MHNYDKIIISFLFLSTCFTFNFSAGVEDSFRHIVKFSDSVEIDLSGVKTPHDIQKFILFDEKVALVENLMINWMKKFDEVYLICLSLVTFTFSYNT